MRDQPDVQTLDSSFQFCPRCGAAQPNPGRNPFTCSQCEFVFYFSPISAVGAIITNPQEEILFVVRGKQPGQGMLGLPGGFVDANETLEASLIREVREETSLTVDDYRYLCSFPNQYEYRGIEIPVTDAFFVCRVSSFEPLAAEQGEVHSFKLAQPEAKVLDQIAFYSNRLAVEKFIGDKGS